MTAPQKSPREQYKADLTDADEEDRGLIEQTPEPLEGARPPEAEDQDHGVLRDDGQPRPEGAFGAILDREATPAISPEDERAPELPDMADTPPTDDAPDDADPQPADDREELKAAYSENDPGVETKE